MDDMFSSGIKLAYTTGHNFIFENGDETEISKLERRLMICPSCGICVNCAKHQKKVCILVSGKSAEDNYASGSHFGENSEPLVCRLEDGVVLSTGLKMIMFYEDPLLRLLNEIIDRVVEAGPYNYWISYGHNVFKIYSRKIAIIYPLDRYYSFNLYHMQPPFFLLLMGWCLSVL